MSTTQETMPAQGQESNVTTPTKGWGEWFTDKVSSVTSSVTGSSQTRESLEAEKAELKTEDRQITTKIEAIDEKIKNLPPVDASAAQVDALQSAGRRRTRRSTKRSTKRSKRSKKTKRSKKGKRTRR